MRFRVAFLTILIVGCFFPLCFADSEWNEAKGKHFIIYYQTTPALAEETLTQAENIYSDEVRYFGSIPEQGFWSWENRCKIYLYDSQSTYLSATGQPEWSDGFADVKERAIISYENAPDFLDTVLPHEMAHLIFRDFVEVGNRQVPRWLDEGFAISQEKRARIYLDEAIKRAVSLGRSIPLREFNRLSALHSTPADQARLFYAQAQSVTRFLLEGRDSSHFLNFCRSLRDGKNFKEALQKGYQTEFSSEDVFEKKWKKFVMAS